MFTLRRGLYISFCKNISAFQIYFLAIYISYLPIFIPLTSSVGAGRLVRPRPYQNVSDSIRYKCCFKGAVGSADPKISKSALLSLNHHNFSNTKPIYTEYSFLESLLNYLAYEIKTKLVDLLPWRQQTTDS